MSEYSRMIHSRHPKPTTYLHVGHPLVTVARPWEAGDRLAVDRVLWPKIQPGEPITCGTCHDPIPYRGGGLFTFSTYGPWPVADEVYLPT